MRRLLGLVVVSALSLSMLVVSIPSAIAGGPDTDCFPGEFPVKSGDLLIMCAHVSNEAGDLSPFLPSDALLFQFFPFVNGALTNQKVVGPDGEHPYIGPPDEPIPFTEFGGFNIGESHYDSLSSLHALHVPGNYVYMATVLVEGPNNNGGPGGIAALSQVEIRVPFEVPFMVLPESPIGVAALIIASLGALGAFAVLRRGNKLTI